MKMFDIDLITQIKINNVADRGYSKQGVMLFNPDGKVFLIAHGCVRSFSKSEYWRLMHEENESLFNRPTEIVNT